MPNAKQVEELERGDIFFVYRPAVENEDVKGLQDVQRFHLVLKPEGNEKYRLITIGRKKLPDVGSHERYWAFVDAVFKDADEARQKLGQQEYETKTRGERTEPTVRPAAEGVYKIVRHGNHTHLAYALELPRKKKGEVQESLNIEPRASYIVSVKNPGASSPPQAGLPEQQKAEYPKELKNIFGGRRFIAVETSELLDHEGTELIMIGAKEDPRDELDIVLNPEEENEHNADVFTDLKLPKEKSREPLFEGVWR